MSKKKVTTTTTTTVVTKTETVNSKPTQIIMVLDRSGSMDSIARATVDGINSFIKEQKAADGEAYMTLVQFDNEYQIDYAAKPLNEVINLVKGETFIPRATTALYDAIGRTINEVKTNDDVIFVIVTDGAENASKEFTQKLVFEKIEEKKKEGWNFLFLAANQDAMKTGGSLGISANNSMTFNANDTSVGNMYMNFSSKVSGYRSAKLYSNNYSTISSTLDFNEEDRKNVDK
jgi:uncharacterized protein YegL